MGMMRGKEHCHLQVSVSNGEQLLGGTVYIIALCAVLACAFYSIFYILLMHIQI
jgi:hypothetical protein